MKQPVAVFDIDGTIIRSSLVIELTHELIKQGIFPEEVRGEFEEEHKNWLNRQGDYKEYLNKLVETYEKHTTGCQEQEIVDSARRVAERHTYQTYRYTRKLVDDLKKTHCLLAISGSPIEVVEPFAKNHGFDLVNGTVKEKHDGIYLDKRALGGSNKDKKLLQHIKDHDLTLEGSVGVGDTESDSSFLELVEEPIVFNPNSGLFQIARSNGWKIVVERKDVVYELTRGKEGYVLS